MATLYSSTLKSGTWNHRYSGRTYDDIGSWVSSQDKSVKGFWQYNYDNNTATVALDVNKNDKYDSGDEIIGVAYVLGSSLSKTGGTWERFNGMTNGGFTGSSSGFFDISSPIIFDTTEKADIITGSKLNDYIDGKGGNDNIAAGAGNDTMIGGMGADKMLGGLGADVFVYNNISESGIGSGRDIIEDFNKAEGDKINLNAIDAYAGSIGNQDFTFIGSNAFSGLKGEVRFSGGILQVNTGTDKIADMEIALTGVTSFKSEFLVL